MRKRATTVLLAVLSLAPGAAWADDLPKEGRFSITYTGVNTSPAKPVAYGRDRDAIAGVSIMTAVNDAGGGLLHNMAGRCLVVTLIDRSSKTQEMHGYCAYADRAGDQVFEEVMTPASTGLGQPARWVGKWTGGTGRYAGLSGEFEVSNSGNIGSDGVFQGAGKKTGNYRIDKP